jgi:hypothetical protein
MAFKRGFGSRAGGFGKFSARPVIVTAGLELIERDTILAAAAARKIATVLPPTTKRKAPKPIRLIDLASLVGIDGGQYFRSKKEAARYIELRRAQDAGMVSNLERNPRFLLHVVNPQGLKVAISEYTGDFSYDEHVDAKMLMATMFEQPVGTRRVIEESKGFPTDDWLLRKKWVEAEYGIQIRVT